MTAPPIDIDTALRDAYALLADGNAGATEARVRQILRVAPDQPAALALLAAALVTGGKPDAAVEIYRRLTALEPRTASHWSNLGTVLRILHQLDAALDAYARAGALGAHSADFFYSVGLLHLERGDQETARQLLRDARDLAPRDAGIALQYAQVSFDSMRLEDALDALAGWQTLEDGGPEVMAQIALLLLNLGEVQHADAALQRALRTQPAPPGALLYAAQVMERSNRVAEARKLFERLRASQLDGVAADEISVLEAQLAAREKQHDLAQRLFRSLANATPEQHRRHLHLFPLAKSLDALGRYDEAYEALQLAHAAQVEQVFRTFPEATTFQRVPLVITQHGCDADDVSRWDQGSAPALDDSPIFIVAFPRSGTTLLEQALDAHPLLATMDEQPFLQYAIDALRAAGLQYPAELALATSAQLDAARERYWTLVRRKVQLAPAQRLIDKNPLNLLRLPAIKRLFPHARIVLAIRHPCDVVLSCYMQHFRAPEFAMLCRSLGTLGDGFRRAFDFWYAQAELLQPHVREVRYESLVADFAAGIRELATFLQIPWDDAMLSPAEHALARRFISTPSYSQVIEPVHRRAVGRWESYRAHFDPALGELAPYLQRWSYET